MREYEAAAAAGMRGFGPGPQPQSDPEKQQLREMLELTQAQLRQSATPLPADAVLRAFPLKYVRPEEVAQALHGITGAQGPKIAIDERTNTVLLAGTSKQIDVAKQLIESLDQPSKSQQNKVADTLQLRIAWLIDELPETEGKAPSEPVISSPVLQALQKLGFDAPRVVCQQLTTLTIQDNRRGGFHFEVPVLIEGRAWQFRGEGTVTPTGDGRYAVEFNTFVQQPNNPQTSQLGGSIFTPLAHYTVMGTTTFVESGGPTSPQQQQHLSAFVMYLDRSPDYPASKVSRAEAKEK